jgi:uncharacterized CHY-type Zn-finger protein
MQLQDETRREERLLKRDLRTVALFVDYYCQKCHVDETKAPFELELPEWREAHPGSLRVCAACRKLLAHAAVKRIHCPLQPKPACKHCPSHCYHPAYRAQMREVMRVAGWGLVSGGRLDFLYHMLF